MKDDLEHILKLCKLYQGKLEEFAPNYPTGSCYISAYFFANYLKDRYNARLVFGSLAIVGKSNKYAVYGAIKNVKNINIGDYHAWCELVIDGKEYIVDPSLKYNIKFLKVNYKFKVSPKVPDIVISDQKSTFNFKYIENSNFRKFADPFIKQIPETLLQLLTLELDTLAFGKN